VVDLPTALKRLAHRLANNNLWSKVRPPQERLPWHTVVAASLAGGATIAILGASSDLFHAPLLVAAFGSSCVLVFLLPDAPLSQPANVIGGHFIAAVAGLTVHAILPVAWWSISIAVAAAMAAMAALRVVHPPAGGTPIAIMLTHEGWGYLFTPVLAGAVVLTLCALTYKYMLGKTSSRS